MKKKTFDEPVISTYDREELETVTVFTGVPPSQPA